MKRYLSFFLAILLVFCMLTACSEGTENGGEISGKDPVIDEALTGVWYEASGSAVLDIHNDGTGKITVNGTAYDGRFSAENGAFSASCEQYALSGKYKLENDVLYVEVPYEAEVYTVAFTREIIVIPEEFLGAHVYKLGEKAYEINIEKEKVICRHLPHPPTDVQIEVEVVVIPECPPGDGQPEQSTEPTTPAQLTVFPKPPAEVFRPEKTDSTDPTTGTPATDTPATDTPATDAPTTGTVPEETKAPEQSKKPDFIPERVKKADGNVQVIKNNETYPTTKGGGSIVGTWTSERQEGHAYIFGSTSTVEYTTIFTFNEDGTGTVFALLFPGTLTWSLTGNRLDITISMLGQTESGYAYVTIAGDEMSFLNAKGEEYVLSRVG